MLNDQRKFFQLLAGSESQLGQVSTRNRFHVDFNLHNMGLSPLKNNIEKLEFFGSLNRNINSLIKTVNLPNMILSKDKDDDVVITHRGNYKTPGETYIIPDEHTFTIEFMDTEYPIMENYFLPWMQDTSQSDWMKSNSILDSPTPFTRANVIITFFENKEEISAFEYIIEGGYPIFVTSPDLDHSRMEIGRTVGFEFNRLKYHKETNRTESDILIDTEQEEIASNINLGIV